MPQKPVRSVAPSIVAADGVPVGIHNDIGIGEIPDEGDDSRFTVIQGIGLESQDQDAF